MWEDGVERWSGRMTGQQKPLPDLLTSKGHGNMAARTGAWSRMKGTNNIERTESDLIDHWQKRETWEYGALQSQRQTQNGLLSHTITRTHVCEVHVRTRIYPQTQPISFPFNMSTPCPLLAPFHLLFIIMRSCFPLLKAGALIVCFPLKRRPRGIMQQSLSLQRDLFRHRWELVLTYAASLSGRNSLHTF